MPSLITTSVSDESVDASILLSDPQWTKHLQQNWTAKKAAFANRDRKEWERIIAEEEQILRDMAE